MTRFNGRRRHPIDLHRDPVAAKMEIVERRTEIAVRITRNAATILTVTLATALTVLWSLLQVVAVFR